MHFSSPGVGGDSHIVFFPVSKTARSLLYYPLCCGSFYCTADYAVAREQYNSILLLYVLDGELCYEQGGRSGRVKKEQLFLLDCYLPHRYHCPASAHTLWLHVDGSNIREICTRIRELHGDAFACNAAVREAFWELAAGREEPELERSQKIYRLLCLLLGSFSSPEQEGPGHCIAQAKEYMEQHYAENLSVQQIAETVHLSCSYFSRLFRQAVGMPPYDYLQTIRLRQAIRLLKQTELPVAGVALRTGFGSTANFICFFKKATGISPLKFRSLVF